MTICSQGKGRLVIKEADATDPKNLIPGQHVVPPIADRAADSTVRRALARPGATLTTKDLAELNRLVDKDKKDPEDIAHDSAAAHGLAEK